METRLLIGGLAVLSSFACLFALALATALSMRKRSASIVAQGDEPNARTFVLWRLRNGYSFADPLVRYLMRLDIVKRRAGELAVVLEERGCPTTGEAIASVVAVALITLALVTGMVAGSVVGALAVPACGIALLTVLIGNHADKRQEAVRDAVPAALESMSVCFGSGFTLLQTFQQVAKETQGPLAATFSRSAHVLEMGGSAQTALSELRDGAHASELAFVAVALDVQHQSGGAMRQVLDAAADTVKGELALRRSLRVQTAQAKLSARVVAIMPFLLVAAFSLASPDFLSPFFASPLGIGLLTLAIVMQVAGIILVRRALAVDGVS